MKVKNIIIDTDPGIDDALAIGLAMYSSNLSLKALTTVHGNVSLKKTTKNALLLRDFFKSEVPVCAGIALPILKAQHGNLAHGESGLDGYKFDYNKSLPHSKSAIEFLKDEILNSSEPYTILAIGPLTNIAVLFRTYPEVISKIEELVVMGGSLTSGNVTQFAEFNFWADPHAAKIVLASDIKKTIVGLDVTNHALVSGRELTNAGNKSSEMLGSIFECYSDGNINDGVWMHDSCTVALMCERDIFSYEDKYVDIILEGPAEGALFEKQDSYKVSYATRIDIPKFKAWVEKTLKLMP